MSTNTSSWIFRQQNFFYCMQNILRIQAWHGLLPRKIQDLQGCYVKKKNTGDFRKNTNTLLHWSFPIQSDISRAVKYTAVFENRHYLCKR